MAESIKLTNRDKQAFIDVPTSNKDLLGACRKHVRSDSHKKAVAVSLVQPLLQDAIKLNDNKTRLAMENKFLCAYWIAQEHMANEKQSTGTLLPGASSVAMIKERAVLRNPSKAQSKELNKLHMNLAESVVIPKVSDNTNVYRDLADKTVSGRVVTPSRKSLEQFGYNYGK